MVKKHSILFGIIIAAALLLAASCYYCSGANYGKKAVGYNSKNTYLNNLVNNKAINELDNPSRWVICGIFFLVKE